MKCRTLINLHVMTYVMSDAEMDEWHNYYDMSDRPE